MQQELSPDDAQLLIEYAKREYTEERWPLSPSLRPTREVLARLGPKQATEPIQGSRPYMPIMLARRNKRRLR